MPNVYFPCNLAPASYVKMFQKFGWNIVNDMEEADLIQFTGGADVNPKHYREAVHPTTSFNDAQDAAEITEFHKALALGLPMAGICRGAQLLNVLGGGKLYQDVNNHALFGMHPAVDTCTLETINVTSTHHQMMRCGSKGHIFLVSCGVATKKEAMVNGIIADFSADTIDVEGVFYPNINALCIQGHPEKTVEGKDPFQEYYFDVIARYLEVA